jgi:hypothetical protein
MGPAVGGVCALRNRGARQMAAGQHLLHHFAQLKILSVNVPFVLQSIASNLPRAAQQRPLTASPTQAMDLLNRPLLSASWAYPRI